MYWIQRSIARGRTLAATLLAGTALLVAPAVSALIISEVMYNPVGPDDGNEWVELYNDTLTAVDLADYSLGWGGVDYTIGTLNLDGAGVLAPGAYVVIGGPASPFDFDPDLENGFIIADGVALFDMDAASITPTTVPIDALIYAILFGFNGNGLLDETGVPGTVDVTIAAAGETAARDAAGNWQASTTPTPGTGPLPPPIPEPSTGLLVGLALAVLPTIHRRKP